MGHSSQHHSPETGATANMNAKLALILFAALVAVASAYHGGHSYRFGYSGHGHGSGGYYSGHRYGRSLSGYKSYGYPSKGYYGHSRHGRSLHYSYGNAYGAHPYGGVSRAVYNQYPSRYGYHH